MYLLLALVVKLWYSQVLTLIDELVSTNKSLHDFSIFLERERLRRGLAGELPINSIIDNSNSYTKVRRPKAPDIVAHNLGNS